MAELTTDDGRKIYFDPAALGIIADKDADTGDAVTTVMGLMAGRLRITETVDAFLTRVSALGNFARLTRPGGSSVWISGKQASVVRPPVAGEYPATVRAVVVIGALNQPLMETPDVVAAALRAAHGNF